MGWLDLVSIAGSLLATGLAHLFLITEHVPRNFFVNYSLGPKKDVSSLSEVFVLGYLCLASICVLHLSLGQRRLNVLWCYLLSQFLYITVPCLIIWCMILLPHAYALTEKDLVAASIVCIWIIYLVVMTITLLVNLASRRVPHVQ
jgi:hypothetical protein